MVEPRYQHKTCVSLLDMQLGRLVCSGSTGSVEPAAPNRTFNRLFLGYFAI